MLTPNDFKLGATAYAVTVPHGGNPMAIISEEQVMFIDSTYLITGTNALKRVYLINGTDYLYEKVDYGPYRRLFVTPIDAENHIKKIQQ